MLYLTWFSLSSISISFTYNTLFFLVTMLKHNSEKYLILHDDRLSELDESEKLTDSILGRKNKSTFSWNRFFLTGLCKVIHRFKQSFSPAAAVKRREKRREKRPQDGKTNPFE
jgi:hypothetical protein